MNILVIISSFRKNGNTTKAVALMQEHLSRQAEHHGVPLSFETVFIGHEDIGMCRGCRTCFNRGEANCPQRRDAMPSIRAKMDSADALILASPIYVEDVNGIMKNWIDRLGYVCHRPAFAGKYAFALTTSGVGSTRHGLKTLARALNSWGYTIAGQAALKTGARMSTGEVREHHDRVIAAKARRFFDAIHRDTARRPSVVSLLFFTLQRRYWLDNADDSVDYTYWKSRGWLEPGEEYFFSHRSSRVKVWMAQAIGQVLAPFVL